MFYARSPRALASPTFKDSQEVLGHARSLPFESSSPSRPPSPAYFDGRLASSAIHSPFLCGSGLDILPTPPLQVPAISLLIPPPTSAYIKVKQQYFPVNATIPEEQTAPLVSVWGYSIRSLCKHFCSCRAVSSPRIRTLTVSSVLRE